MTWLRTVGAVACGLAILGHSSVAGAQSASSTPTFTDEVAQILFDHCVECHRPGEVAPMSLMSYQDARPWARSIKAKVVSREMPPWFADPRYGQFRNERRLTQTEIDTLVAWVDHGAPRGDGTAPDVPVFPDGWSNFMGRAPDAIVEMPVEIVVPAQGELPNFTVWGENPFEEDVFLQAVELRPGNRRVTHHSSTGARPLPEGTRLGSGPAWSGGPVVDAVPVHPDGRPFSLRTAGDVNEEAATRARQARGFSDGSAEFERLLLFYVPGGGVQKFRPGMAKRIRKDDHLTWGLHYSPTGVEETDRHRLGVWFQEGVITHEVVTAAVTGNQIVEGAELNGGRRPVIPPHAGNWRITGITAFRDAVTITGLWPHMHLRGKDMTFVVTYPDGGEKTILSVPNYDFNWQVQYELVEPLKLPAGSTIKAIAHYDNSIGNRYNPAPNREVYWSEQSWDEMFLPFLELTVDKHDLSKDTPETN